MDISLGVCRAGLPLVCVAAVETSLLLSPKYGSYSVGGGGTGLKRYQLETPNLGLNRLGVNY